MYDTVTAELIRSTPPLQGLDRERLPDLFSETFARIAAARIGLREAKDAQSEPLVEMIDTMRRLAHTNEALVAVLPEREDRTAAAFVAATAHQLAANADRQLAAARAPTRLSERTVSSDIAAMLLFMIAEAMPDATEMARVVQVEDETSIESALIVALRDLASGRLLSLADRSLPPPESVAMADGARTANAALYRLILQGIHALAQQLLYPESNLASPPSTIFERVRSLSLGRPLPLEERVRGPVSAFPGPHHLASLLVSLARDIGGVTVTHIDPPPGIDPNAWTGSMRRIAKTRPFLWRNHRRALAKGYLSPNVSAVVAFPTGAGKSALAELKINATLLEGYKVVFLAPTNALVDQTSASLRKSFPEARVRRARAYEVGIPSGEVDLPEIFVMTPEACLTLMSIDNSVFEDVGLFVFDECHLLHPTETAGDRRAIDSMLCLVSFAQSHPQSTFLLLSAMMSNADTLAGWIGELTGRPCLALDLPWKPTRQLRGSVVYKQHRISVLEQKLTTARHTSTTAHPPLAVKRELTARPLALFGLKQTWASLDTNDYALVSLLNKNITLNANRYWKPTPNAVAVTAEIAAAAAQSEVKTLAFFQSIKNAASAARQICKALGPTQIRLTQDEERWLNAAELELGDSVHLYLNLNNGLVTDQATVHHGLLLPEERRLCEALYQRTGGLKALTATSTLAQGMNLPCELVIIGEDSRFDQAKDKRRILEARELLNAAGRAGRAGQGAAGLVLVVPGKVVGIDFDAATIGNHWSTLREIFSQSDQCLEIDDPLTRVLDNIHVNVDATGEIEHYAIARLVSSAGGDGSEERLASAISATFAAYKARKGGDTSWLKERQASATQYFRSQLYDTDESSIEDQIAASLGLSVDLVRRLSIALANSQPDSAASIHDWITWFFHWLADNPDLLEKAFRQQNLAELFGHTAYYACDSEQGKTDLVLPILSRLTRLWINGRPLRELEVAFGTDEDKLKFCENARRFVLRVVPDLSYLFGLPALLQARAQATEEVQIEVSSAKAQLSQCVRIGFDSFEKVALNQVLGSTRASRCHTHQKYAQIKPNLELSQENETWDEVIARIRRVVIDHA